MTSPFFGLLPTDLQIGIFYVWLNAADCGFSLLRVLSALDVACSPSEQPSLRHLMGQLPPFGDYTFNNASSGTTWYTVNCLQWLGSRHVPVRTLLTGTLVNGERLNEPNQTLPLIETLRWHGTRSSEAMATMLQCLPNLTAIHQSSLVGCSLQASITPHLKVLTLTERPGGDMRPFVDTCSLLEELRIGQYHLTTELADWLVGRCPNLKLLGVSAVDMKFTKKLCLVLAKLCLNELILRNLQFSQIDLVASSLPSCWALTLDDLMFTVQDTEDEIVAIAGKYPNISCIKTSICTLSRCPQEIHLTAYLSNAQMGILIDTCDALEVLSVDTDLHMDLAVMLVSKVSSALRSLTLNCVRERAALELLLKRCGASLRNLVLECGHRETGCPLALIAATCPQLISLSFNGAYASASREDDFSAVFIACRQITELTLGLCVKRDRRAVLRAILCTKLRLKLLKLVVSYNDSSADCLDVWFRQLAVEQKVLPVPAIIKQASF